MGTKGQHETELIVSTPRVNTIKSFQRTAWITVVSALLVWICAPSAAAQSLIIQDEGSIPLEVDHIYKKGLTYLAGSQNATGHWRGSGENGVTALCLMAFLASGDDPNYGQYSRHVRSAIRALLTGQEPDTGYYPSSLYHHGFTMLALAEAYGAVDESLLWGAKDRNQVSIAESLQKAVAMAEKSQKSNRFGGWRYSPTSNDADTSVTGSVVMGLLACKNAGIAVSDKMLTDALDYIRTSTASNGYVAYSGGMGSGRESMNRSALATLVFAVAQHRDWDEFKATKEHISTRLDHKETGHPHYFLYYMAQAMFQTDYPKWQLWNERVTKQLATTQAADGHFTGSYGESYGTAMSLLSLALNYRFLPIYERF
ncbi:MAG: squalene--hopene cyclase [Verrucomicrobiota bacterium]